MHLKQCPYQTHVAHLKVKILKKECNRWHWWVNKHGIWWRNSFWPWWSDECWPWWSDNSCIDVVTECNPWHSNCLRKPPLPEGSHIPYSTLSMGWHLNHGLSDGAASPKTDALWYCNSSLSSGLHSHSSEEALSLRGSICQMGCGDHWWQEPWMISCSTWNCQCHAWCHDLAAGRSRWSGSPASPSLLAAQSGSLAMGLPVTMTAVPESGLIIGIIIGIGDVIWMGLARPESGLQSQWHWRRRHITQLQLMFDRLCLFQSCGRCVRNHNIHTSWDLGISVRVCHEGWDGSTPPQQIWPEGCPPWRHKWHQSQVKLNSWVWKMLQMLENLVRLSIKHCQKNVESIWWSNHLM